MSKSHIFNVANMYFNAFPENKILTIISEFTVCEPSSSSIWALSLEDLTLLHANKHFFPFPFISPIKSWLSELVGASCLSLAGPSVAQLGFI